jgi:hypothetical protein
MEGGETPKQRVRRKGQSLLFPQSGHRRPHRNRETTEFLSSLSVQAAAATAPSRVRGP